MLETVVAVEVVVVVVSAVAKELDWGKVIDVVGNVVIVISYLSFRQRKMLKKKFLPSIECPSIRWVLRLEEEEIPDR